MALIDHIKRCNAFDPSRYLPFTIAGHPIGAVTRDFAAKLAAFPEVFVTEGAAVRLRDELATPEARTAAVEDVLEHMREAGSAPKKKGELYRVVEHWGDGPLMLIDRAAVPVFGIRAFGVHLNGFVRRNGAIRLWIAQRAADRVIEPGKLDNMVAGGQPAGLDLRENLIKESAEEAGIASDMAQKAVPVGVLGYCMDSEWGLKPDTLFVYDLEVPADFTPRNTDGEVSAFRLMEASDILDLLRNGQSFKFNVPLVLIDFFIRHGLLSPDTEPQYLDLVRGVRAGL
ncbi:DUF4743 domain-containing protein [Telmatospirillum siberiense]|uniref:DUF4743 domain-containing protein n=2 Tax=Telmatospirillum siberiense TaxID=382514 RepID=A0A2N3PMX6_9PROT|nr:DUF4743 domain-containing protein [Telmatospirillum siberiense]